MSKAQEQEAPGQGPEPEGTVPKAQEPEAPSEEAQLEMILKVSAEEEHNRLLEDDRVRMKRAEYLARMEKNGNSIKGIFDPKADGNCLLSCFLAAKHPGREITKREVDDLRLEVVARSGAQGAEAEVMEKPGTVMGEKEVQAYANLSGKVVTIHSYVCSGGDDGILEPLVFNPNENSDGSSDGSGGINLICAYTSPRSICFCVI